MQTEAEKEVWRRCEEMGIAAARARTQTVTGIMERQYILSWLEFAERNERLASEKKNFDLAERNARAAEASALAALDSARTSGTSARAAMFAAFVSLLALVVAIAAYLKQA